MKRTSRLLGGLLLSGLILSGGEGRAQDPPEPSAPTPRQEADDSSRGSLTPSTTTTPPSSVPAQEARLGAVLAARAQIESELHATQQELGSAAARGREQELEERIRSLSQELSELDRNFSELASGVDPQSIEIGQEDEGLNLASEVRDLLGPLVNELKRATSRPREIDRLRTEISELQERLAQIGNALARIEQLRSQLTDPIVLAEVDEEARDWNRRRGALRTSLQVAQQKLFQRLDETQSITQAVENLFQLFFKSRGRNLLLALLAMLVFLLGFRRLRRFMAERPMWTRRSESFEARLFNLAYSAFTVVGAILVFLVALYLFGDWVLLILVLLLIFGVIWTSKQAIPRFWSQTVLMLDMGPVRAGERVQYNGLSWRVESVSFYSILRNPVLVGGMIRLPIDDLAHLRSRADREDEPWFPTRPNDVVLLSDGRAVEVEFQSIDTVRLRAPGGAGLIVPAAEFAGQAVERLSDGYRVETTFGLDYGDQAAITTTMRDTLQRGVEERWRGSRWADALVDVSVEFQEAGASSLDFFVRVDLEGAVALDYRSQQRMLVSFCVDVCNEQGWVIPFTQLTLHVAEPKDLASGGGDDSKGS